MNNCSQLVSIIVPIYNVENYLNKCVESIVGQTYTNIEIILVDDGSKDNCPKICDMLAKKDNRIKVIHKENGGLSDARNSGLDICKGEYIVFVDSDDYIEKNMVELLHNNIEKNKSDISICDFYITSNEKDNLNTYAKQEFSILGKEKYNYLYNEYSKATIVAWNKMYKRFIFDEIRYPKGRLHEDEFVICDILSRANSISYIMKPLYHYVQRENSIMGKVSINRFDIIDALDSRILFLKKIDDTYNIKMTKYQQFFRLLGLLTRLYAQKDFILKEDFLNKYINKIKKIGNEIKNYNFLKFTEKCKLILVLISPMLYIKLVNAIRKIGRGKI